jgi:plastocyanin
MSIRFCSFVALMSAATVIVGCENRSQPVSPSTVANEPSAVSQPSAGVAGPAQLAAKRPSQHVVSLFDACDPETFNAALGEGACTRSGGVRFDTFLEQLGRHHSIGAWHFAPSNVTMKVGELLVATNRGGEVHTFTEVEEFGGGVVDQLNQLTGLTEVAPECAALAGRGRIAPGASSTEEEEEAGVEKYQCCIHPWMRAQVRIAEK